MLSATHDDEAGEHVGCSLTASYGWLSGASAQAPQRMTEDPQRTVAGHGGGGPARAVILGPPGLGAQPGGRTPVGAENYVTSCDLGIFVDQATEPVAPQHMDTRTFCG
jgi:hypothetical protein